MNIADVERNIDGAANLLKALSNEKRLRIVCTLFDKEKSVSELERVIGLSQSALSQHLARLRRDGIVTTRRSAQTIYYSLQDRATHSVLACLHDIFCVGK